MQYALLALVAFFASAFSTLAGFGAGIVLIGVASLFMDVKEIVPLSTGYFLVLSAFHVVIFRRSADWQSIKLYCLGALPGILGGMALFYVLDSTTVKRVLAVLVLAYCANGLLKLVPERTPGSRATVGLSFLAGVVDAITASGGVIQAPTYLARGLRKEAFVASFAMTSIVLNPIKLGIYHVMGFLEMGSLPLLGILAVSGILGVQLGRLGLRYISPESFRRLALGFLALVALRMLVW